MMHGVSGGGGLTDRHAHAPDVLRAQKTSPPSPARAHHTCSQGHINSATDTAMHPDVPPHTANYPQKNLRTPKIHQNDMPLHATVQPDRTCCTPMYPYMPLYIPLHSTRPESHTCAFVRVHGRTYIPHIHPSIPYYPLRPYVPLRNPM